MVVSSNVILGTWHPYSWRLVDPFGFLFLQCAPGFQSGVSPSTLMSDNMTNKWHVYMTKYGRISLAGLSLAKCEYLADAIIDSYHNVSWDSLHGELCWSFSSFFSFTVIE